MQHPLADKLLPFQRELAAELAASSAAVEKLPFPSGIGREMIMAVAAEERFAGKPQAKALYLLSAGAIDPRLQAIRTVSAHSAVALRAATDLPFVGAAFHTLTTPRFLRLHAEVFATVSWDLVIAETRPRLLGAGSGWAQAITKACGAATVWISSPRLFENAADLPVTAFGEKLATLDLASVFAAQS